MQHFNKIYINLYFFGKILDTAEVTALLSLGIVKIFSTILSLMIVEKCGRRTALITSATICMTTISLLSLLATIDKDSNNINIEDIHRELVTEQKIQNIIPIGSPPPFPLLPTPLAVIESTPENWTQIKASYEVIKQLLLIICN